eukprot:GFYU01002894.1.p1 GENE.GFYU01002894.1~~GFYU01002894.1.p1  ORF type:complete len:371 (+),score=141.13 GFYU01002894.1:34-1113(+)
MGLVTLAYEDLVNGKDLTAEIKEAYGSKGLGALAISGVPGFVEAREAFIDEMYKFAHLSEDVKKKYEHEPSMYNVGWSFGKEKLGETPDISKGSYYCNPCFDEPYDAATREKFPWAAPQNIWPKDELPKFETTFKALGKIQFEASLLLAKQIDNLVKKEIPGYEEGTLYNLLKDTQKIKGRGLHYFPMDDEMADKASWIGWHNDTGFLTTLTAAQFFNDETGEKIKNPDPNGGLWVTDRDGGEVKVSNAPENLMVQCGECLQIITGGLLVATPHCVKASKNVGGVKVSRTTFPCFIDCNVDYVLRPPKGRSVEDVFDKTMASLVPPLSGRWQGEEVTFADFLGNSFKQFYEWAMKDQKA